MKLSIKKQIGKTEYPFQVEGDNLHDLVMQAQKLSFGDVPKCGICGSDNLILEAHVAQNKYKYTSVKCLNCKASVTFGQRQEDPSTYYLRKNGNKELDWQEYKAE